MRIGILCSAGGSSFFSAYDLLYQLSEVTNDNFLIITDRECNAELMAVNRGIKSKRIPYLGKLKFSTDVARYLDEQNVTMLLMLFSRLVGAELHQKLPTLNIHPALLPAFQGLNATAKAFEAGVKFIGATLHLATEAVDSGAILGQVISPISPKHTLETINKISYLQKTYLVTALLDACMREMVVMRGNQFDFNDSIKNLYSSSASPLINTVELRESFNVMQNNEIGHTLIL